MAGDAMRVLFVASECVPFIKTGGLGDVVGALPLALGALGIETRVLLPGYTCVLRALKRRRTIASSSILGESVSLITGEAGGLSILALDAPALYDRTGGPYADGNGRDWPDNAQRFAVLAKAASMVAVEGADGWHPDLVHAHDWQAGLLPVYLAAMRDPSPPAVMTIHNIAFQGVFPASLRSRLELPSSLFHRDGYEFWDKIGFLKGGLATADRITTVSPSYARELMMPEFGMGLEGLLRHRRAVVSGILNGIDTIAWDPENDAALPEPYSAARPAGKAAAKTALARRFGLDPDPAMPTLAVVSRLTAQKGLDLLPAALDIFLGRGGRLVVLGTGEPALEDTFRALSAAWPGQVGVEIGFDEALAHLIFGGADAICIPSRYEPCGLTQLYGLRYGCLPVVARTGGLADTVIDANPAALASGVATGIQLAPLGTASIEDGLDRLWTLWQDRAAWRRVRGRAMRQPVGWDVSARTYADLYSSTLAERRAEIAS